MYRIVAVFIISAMCIRNTCSSLYDPCPEYFKYVLSASEAYGIVTIPGPSRGKTILQVTVGVQRGNVYEEYDDKNTVRLYTIKPLDDALREGEKGVDIEFKLDFPDSEEQPFITKITLNHRDVCIGPNVTTSWTKTYSQYIDFPKDAKELSTIKYRNTSPPTNDEFISLPFTDMCGRSNKEKDKFQISYFIIGGEKADKEEYPWLVALFRKSATGREYICAGSLITDKHILTAAHCETNTYSEMQIEIGRYDLRNTAERFETRNPVLIVAHSQYVAGKPDHDIAIIFIQPVRFTADIKPICIWGFGTRYDADFQDGTITGWGRVENDGDKSPVPRKLRVRKVDESTCRKSNQVFDRIVTKNTFCAGGQSKGPCHGDSGSGFYQMVERVWYLRGIISTSLGNSFVCYTDEYAVYTDIARYYTWIHEYVSIFNSTS